MAQLRMFPGYEAGNRRMAVGGAASIDLPPDFDAAFGEKIRVTITGRITKILGHAKTDEEGDGILDARFSLAAEDFHVEKL